MSSISILEQAIVIPNAASTLEGFRAWARSEAFPERGHISFLDGEIIVDMSPEELETHNKVKTEVGYVLVGLNKKLKVGTFYSDRTLLSNVEANLSTEPDAMLATWETLEAGRLRYVPRESAEEQSLEVEGSPDWVLEIVSDTSVRKDTKQLLEQYFRAGVREYWLIDARGDEIDFQILVRGETGFEEVQAKKGWVPSPLFGRRFRLTRRRDQINRWEYTLQMKALPKTGR